MSLGGNWIAVGGVLVELMAALVIAFHAAWALTVAILQHDADRPRLIIAAGVLTALGFSVAGTLLRALSLQSWSQIGMFAFALAFRTLLKHIFEHERSRMAARVRR